MTASKLRIGLVGLDHWYTALSLAQQLARHERWELAGIADPDIDHAREAARRAGVPDLAGDDPTRLLEDDSIDVIASFISVDRNPEICVAAADRGKHLLSIKPLARTLDEATAIVDAVRRNGVRFLPAESRSRLSPQSQQLREWFGEGRLGRLLTASFSLWASLPKGWPDASDPGWFADPGRTPGGGWIDHSIYSIDLLRWLLGEEVASVAGVVANLKYPDLPVEDYGSATVVFEGGTIATIEDTWHGPPGVFRTAVSLVGSKGAVQLDSVNGKLSAAGDFPPFTSWVQTAAPAAHAEGLDHLAAVVSSEEEPIATVDDAWRNLAACLAFYEAAASGQAVRPAALTTTGEVR
jgi:predicted dehydrogenase